VEVALDPAKLRLLDVDRARPRLLETLDAMLSSRIDDGSMDEAPGMPSLLPRRFVPTAAPAASAAITNAIHPSVAVFQCAALQRPARAARFSLMGLPFHSFLP
jgi:hypothetical protein